MKGAFMKFCLLVLSIGLLSQALQASEIASSKDWRADKDIMTPLQKMGCVAETTTSVVDVDGNTEQWTLQVIKLATGNGDYSFPMIISFPEGLPTNEYYEASGVSNRPEVDPFSMTLLQPENGDKTIVANRLIDRNRIVNRLKADATFTVNYLSKQGPTRSAVFSLRGSSSTIQAMLDTCN